MQSLHFTKEAKAKKEAKDNESYNKEQSPLVSEDTKDQKRMQDVTPTTLPLFS